MGVKNTILLNASENTSLVEEEEKTRFIRSILEEFELPLEGIWEEDGSQTLESKLKLRSLLNTYGIQIVDDGDGGVHIYCDGIIIGKFGKPEYILKRDLQARDPKKKLFLEMKTSCWSILEEDDQGTDAP